MWLYNDPQDPGSLYGPMLPLSSANKDHERLALPCSGLAIRSWWRDFACAITVPNQLRPFVKLVCNHVLLNIDILSE